MHILWATIKSFLVAMMAVLGCFVLLGIVLWTAATVVSRDQTSEGVGAVAIGWDPVSMLIQWGVPRRLAGPMVFSTPFAIFGLAFLLSFMFFTRRPH